jgi:hypothetical protein
MGVDIMLVAVYWGGDSCSIGIKGLTEMAEEAGEAGFWGGHV